MNFGLQEILFAGKSQSSKLMRDLSEEILNYYLREDDYLLTGIAQADLVLKNSFPPLR